MSCLGHGHPAVVAAIQEQAGRLDVEVIVARLGEAVDAAVAGD